jgi:hypothetical protein
MNGPRRRYSTDYCTFISSLSLKGNTLSALSVYQDRLGQRKRFVDPDRSLAPSLALEQLTYNVQRNDHPNTKS